MASFSGPMFNGQIDNIVESFRAQCERDIAEEGKNLVVGRLIQVIRQPTPYYWTQIETISRRGGTEVTGESVIYHWWLEGVGLRNFPVTRFKGYRTFSLMTVALDGRAERMANDILRQYIPRMGN